MSQQSGPLSHRDHVQLLYRPSVPMVRNAGGKKQQLPTHLLGITTSAAATNEDDDFDF